MAVPTFPSVTPSAGSGLSTEARVLEKSLGDGYVLSAADGINHLARTYEARFDAAPKADIESIAAFLEARGGHEPFMFQPPGEAAAIKWRCKSWRGPTWVSATHRSLSATFVEDFSP